MALDIYRLDNDEYIFGLNDEAIRLFIQYL
jgi:hypothetical protein